MKRATLAAAILSVLLLADGAYLQLTHNEVGGDEGTFFGDPRFVLSAGTTVLIAGGMLLIVTAVMWLVARRQPAPPQPRPRAAAQPESGDQQAAQPGGSPASKA
ncbi:MAG: hypothetical protein ACLQDY_03320 [Streptosporangiaceae bacterium]